MILNKLHFISFFIIALIFAVACNPTKKILKSDDNEYKYNKALEFYENEKYDRAMPIIENLIPQYVYTKKGEELYYMYAMAHYHVQDYILAGYYLKKFTSKYPSSDKGEKALFLSALCYVHESPNYSLDQAETRNAINELQLFMNKYPNTNRKDTCNQIIDRLNSKLERKEYEKTKLYFQTGNYKAAVVSVKTNLDLYPNTIYKEDLMYMLVKAGYLLAENSIFSKKLERYEATIKSYRTFATAFPESKHLKELTNYNNKAVQEAALLRNESDS